MWMTEGEIRTSYRQAKHPKEQIAILAELNAVSKEKIREILGISKGVKRKVGTKWTSDQVEFMLEKKKQGKTAEEIAEEMGRSAAAIANKLRNLRKEGKKIAKELEEEESGKDEEEDHDMPFQEKIKARRERARENAKEMIAQSERLTKQREAVLCLVDMYENIARWPEAAREMRIELRGQTAVMHAVCGETEVYIERRIGE